MRTKETGRPAGTGTAHERNGAGTVAEQYSADNLSALASAENEMCALGSALLDADAVAVVVAELTPEDFTQSDHRNIFEAIRDMLAGSKPVDLVTLPGELQRRGVLDDIGPVDSRGVAYLAELAQSVPSAANIAHYVDAIRECSRRRTALDHAERLKRAATDPTADIDCAAEAVVRAMAKPKPADADEWEPFPVDALGEPLAGFCRAVGESVGCDPAFAAVPMLGAMAGAVGNGACVELKPGRAGWTEPAILWTMPVGRSGEGKSPAQEAVLRPMQRRQSVAFSKWRQLRAAAAALGDKAEPVPPPERFIVKETTVEAVADRLEKNPRGLLLAMDELAGWLRGFGQYKGGRGDDAAQWLTIHDGRPLSIDRKNPDAPLLYIPRPAVSVVGGIQPGKLRRVMTAELMDSGFGPRLHMAWPPSAPMGWTDATVDDELAGRVDAVFDALLALPMDTDENGEPAPRRFTLSAGARAVFIEHVNGIGVEQADADATDADAAALSKSKGAAARIALVLHLARHHRLAEELLPDQIGADTMRSAVRIARWFADEGRRIRRKLGLDADAPTVGKRRAGSGASLAFAVAFLRERLAGGPVAMVEVEADAKVRGIAERTLRRAKEKLEVLSARVGGFGGEWHWAMPVEGGQPAEGGQHGQVDPDLAAFDEPIDGQGNSPKVAKVANMAKSSGSGHVQTGAGDYPKPWDELEGGEP